MSHAMAGYGFVPPIPTSLAGGGPSPALTPPPTASSTSSRPLSTMTMRAATTTASGAPLSAVALVAAGAGPPGGMPGTPTTLLMHPGANPDGSLFHQCAALLDRLAAIPCMQAYLDYATTAIGNTASGQPDVVPVPSLAGGTLLPGAAAAATAATAADAPSAIAGLQRSDPVTLLWTMLRVGEPLALLFNLAVPDHPIELASGKLAVQEGQMLPDRDGRCTAPSPVYLAQALATINSMKAMVYHTIVGLRTHNPQVNILASIDADLFTIGELYQDDTSGFLKVLRTVRLVLDWLERAGRIQAPLGGGGGGSPVATTAPDAPPVPVMTRRPSRMQLFTGAMASSVRGTGGTRTSDGSGGGGGDEPFSPTMANGAPPDRSSSGSSGATAAPTAPPKELTHREKILIEMLQTERKYVADLERLHTYQHHLSTNNVLPPGTISALFSNLKALVDFQRGFLVGLESLLVQAAAGDEKVGSLFVSLEPTFAAVYAPFCANFKQASDLAVDNVHVLQAAAQVMEPQHELPSYLIKPIQRICRYPLLLRELIKKTPAEEYSEALAQDLQDGLEAIQRVTESVNEARRMHENQLVKEDLVRRVEDWKGHDVNSFGSLLLHDRFMMQIQDYERELVIFLFEKIILCCKMLVAPVKQSGGGSTAATLLKRKSRGKSQSGSSLANASILSSAASIMTSATGGGGGGDVSFSVSSGASGADGSGDGVTYQIKGRIWIGGITDLNGGEVDGSWLLTVSWKSPAKIEFFTLRCRNDEQFRLWLSTIQRCVEETRERGRARMLAQQQQAQQVPQQQQLQQQRGLSSRLANVPQPILTSPPTSYGSMGAPTPQISQAPLFSPRPDAAGFGVMTPTVSSGAMSRPPMQMHDDSAAEGQDDDARSFVDRDADDHDQDDLQYPSTVTQGNGSGPSTSRFAPVAYRNPPSYDEFSASEYSSRKSSASSGIGGPKSSLDAQLAELSMYARNGGGEHDDIPQRTVRQPPRVPLPTPPQVPPPSGPPPMRASHVPPSANELPPRTASAYGPPLPSPLPAPQTSSGQLGAARNDNRSRSRDVQRPTSRRSPSVPRMPPPPTMPPPEMSLPPVPGPPPRGPPMGPPPPLPPMPLPSPPLNQPPAMSSSQHPPQAQRAMSSPATSGGSSPVVGPPQSSGSSPSLGHAHMYTAPHHRSASPAAVAHPGSVGYEPQGPSQAYMTRRRSSLANSITATPAQSQPQPQHPSSGAGSPANSASPVLSAVNAANRGSRASSSLSHNNNNSDAKHTPTMAPTFVQMPPPASLKSAAELPNTPPEVAPPPRIRNGSNATNPLDQGLMLTDTSVSSEDDDMLGSELGMSELSALQDVGQLQLLPPGSVVNTTAGSARRPSASSGSGYRGLRLQMPPTLSTSPTGTGTATSTMAGGPKSAPPVVTVPSRTTSIGQDHQAVAREGSEVGVSTSPNVRRTRADSEASYQSRGRSGTLQSMNDDNVSVVSSAASAVSAMSGSTAVAAIPEHPAVQVARERERSRSQSRSRSQTRQSAAHNAGDRSRSRSRSQSRTRANGSQHPRALAEATGEEMPEVPELPATTAAVVPTTASASNSPVVSGAQRHTYAASHAAAGVGTSGAMSEVGMQNSSPIPTRAMSMAAPGVAGQSLPPMPNTPSRIRRPRSPSPLPPGSPSSPGIEVVKCKVYHSGHVYVLLAPRGTTYSGLVAQIKRKIGRTAAEIRIKYEDAEGDYIQISSDEDLGAALDVALRRSRKMAAGMPTSVASNPVMLEMFVFDV